MVASTNNRCVSAPCFLLSANYRVHLVYDCAVGSPPGKGFSGMVRWSPMRCDITVGEKTAHLELR